MLCKVEPLQLTGSRLKRMLPLLQAYVRLSAACRRRPLVLAAALCVVLLRPYRKLLWPPVDDACSLAHALEQQPPSAPDDDDSEVRLFWWYRFRGFRRSVHWPQRFNCSGGLRCVSDSRAEAFARAHGVIVWVGPDRRASCLPPQRAEHVWVLEYSESPAYYPELLDPAFTRRFRLKVELDLVQSRLISPGLIWRPCPPRR